MEMIGSMCFPAFLDKPVSRGAVWDIPGFGLYVPNYSNDTQMVWTYAKKSTIIENINTINLQNKREGI